MELSGCCNKDRRGNGRKSDKFERRGSVASWWEQKWMWEGLSDSGSVLKGQSGRICGWNECGIESRGRVGKAPKHPEGRWSQNPGRQALGHPVGME